MKRKLNPFLLVGIILSTISVMSWSIVQHPVSGQLNVPTECHVVGQGLPDPNCTPGGTNPDVNQNNIQDTICKTGFTKMIRPPVSFTEPLKLQLMQSYGFGGDSPHDYELDHLIPLEVGGNPTSVQNLWPQPGYGTYNYHVKDKLENYLRGQVCSGNISLSDAQSAIETNWIASLNSSGISIANVVSQADNFPGMPSFMTVEPNATQ